MKNMKGKILISYNLLTLPSFLLKYILSPHIEGNIWSYLGMAPGEGNIPTTHGTMKSWNREGAKNSGGKKSGLVLVR